MNEITARARQALPLRVDPDALMRNATRSLARAAHCAALTKLSGKNVRPPSDDREALAILERTATPPLTTTGSVTAFTPVVPLFLKNLVGHSAAAALLDLCIGLDFAHAAAVTLPSLPGPINAGWIGETSAIPVRRGASQAGPRIDPHKLAVITSLTNELVRHSNAVELIQIALRESVAPVLDTALFSNTAATSISPAGLLVGATAVTPSTASGRDAMAEDLAALAGSVSAYSGNSQIAYVMGQREAVFVGLTAERLPANLLVSSAVPAKQIICVATQAIVSTVETLPSIDVSFEAAFHEYDPASPLVDIGGVMAAPIRSTYQTDSIALRLLLPITWLVRQPSAIAVMSNVSW